MNKILKIIGWSFLILGIGNSLIFSLIDSPNTKSLFLCAIITTLFSGMLLYGGGGFDE